MKLKNRWDAAIKPCDLRFADVYMRVRMRGWTAFLFWYFFLYRDIKRFDAVPVDRVRTLYRGINLWVIRWGEFYVDSVKDYESIILDYDQPDNAWLTRRIVDKVRVECGQDKYIGKFCLRIFHREWFICWFTLERK